MSLAEAPDIGRIIVQENHSVNPAPSYIDAYINNMDDLNSINRLSVQSGMMALPYTKILVATLTAVTLNTSNVAIGVNNTSFSIVNNYTFYNYTAKLDIVQIACGDKHTLFLENTGKVLGCGYDTAGQLGLGIINKAVISPTYLNISNFNIVQVACGKEYSMLLTNSGEVLCSGENSDGQLGIGSTDSKNSFVYVQKDETNLKNVIQIACGNAHTMFLLNSGNVLACGNGLEGELGQNNNSDIYLPVDVKKETNTNLTNVVQIACGAYHSIFLLDDNTLMGCGDNNYKQLIDNNDNAIKIAKPISISFDNSLSNKVLQISCGEYHTAILLNSGKVIVCGLNNKGQLGIYNISLPNVKTTHIYVKGDSLGTTDLTNVKKVMCGAYHTLFLMNTGDVLVCGDNAFGQLGSTNFINPTFSIPTNIKDIANNILSNIRDIATGPTANHNFFITNNVAGIMSNGLNTQFQLGNTTKENIPVVMSASYSENNFYATEEKYSDFKKMEFGSTNLISDYNPTIQMASSPFNTVYIDNYNNVKCNGYNQHNMLGILNINNTIIDTTGTGNLANIINVATGIYHVIFLKSDGKAYSCGNNNFGQLGSGDYIKKYRPIILAGADNINIKDIACGANHNMFLKNDKTVFACGKNDNGQLGLGYMLNGNPDLDNRTLLTQVKGYGMSYNLQNIQNIKCGENHTVFLTVTDIVYNEDKTINESTSIFGNVYTCGNNTYGQLGHNTVYPLVPFPMFIADSKGNDVLSGNYNPGVIIKIACGRNHTVIVDSSGIAYSFGNNNNNQLGFSGVPFAIYPQMIKYHKKVLDVYSNHFLDKTYLKVLINA